MKIQFLAKAVETVGTKAAPVMFQLKRHLPEILVGTGVVSIAGGTVLACRATLKAQDVLSDPIETSYSIVDPETGEEMEVEAEEPEIRMAQVKKGAKVALSYLPAAGLIGGGVAMLVGAKSIEHRRLTAALGAYSSLEAMFEAYRGRIIAEHGPDTDTRALRGEHVETGYILEEPEEEGKKPKRKKTELVVRDDEDPFHRIYDECNSPTEWRDTLKENVWYLELTEKRLNQKLNATGRVFLNDVYEALGFDYLPIGQFVGWLASDIEGSKDGFISFGIDYAYLQEEIAKSLDGNDYVPEPNIWLEFNCDGQVWDSPLKKKRENL